MSWIDFVHKRLFMYSLPSPTSSHGRQSSQGSWRSFRSATAATPHSDGHDAIPLPEPMYPAHQESASAGSYPSAGMAKRPALSPTPSITSSTRSLRSHKHSSLPIATSRAPPLPVRAASAFEETSTSGSVANHHLSPIVEQDQLSPDARLMPLPTQRTIETQFTAPSGGAPESSDLPRTCF
ncbi:hypothetical protein FIBSPDRAFT_75500 [Athelia psychrophila]|uniref:Uncharacterized protein n=1 Tax=Athelia psychrophila TaxID=1759441 RepID=A0A166EKP0_9AGAM|nr:hypothetical protein FIBSPDRAFT_75500 [Fibularhizoctonia sp. CBS 109695]